MCGRRSIGKRLVEYWCELVGCGHVYGLLVQRCIASGPDVVRWAWVPITVSRWVAPTVQRSVPPTGLTRFASSHRPRQSCCAEAGQAAWAVGFAPSRNTAPRAITAQAMRAVL